jgi:predicted  nucleic acid-binding Zn-ribbon protein
MMTAGSVQPRPGLTPYQAREGGPCFLSDMVIELGFAEAQHVEAAVEAARSSGETVGRILVREGRLSEDQLARALAARYGLNHVDLDEFTIDPEAANLLPASSAQRYKSVPVGFEPDGSLLVAMADPSDSLALSDIAFMTHLEVRAVVAAADRMAELAASLPLPPNESGGSRFPVMASAPEPEPLTLDPPGPAPEVAPPAPEDAVAPPGAASEPVPAPAPVVDSAELEQARAELDGARSEIDGVRSELDVARSELDGVRSELDGVRSERDLARTELDGVRSERDLARTELDGVRSELERTRSELEAVRLERDGMRSDLEAGRGELEVARSERDAARSERDRGRDDLETARSEAEAVRGDAEKLRGELQTVRGELEAAQQQGALAAEASKRAAEAERRATEFERRLADADGAEQRVAEAHSMVEKMRNEFELEREGYAATERDLRARLASEEEQHGAAKEAHASVQKRMEVLRTQNAALLDAYATAKRWSAEFARGARELAATLEQPVLDDAVRAQQQSQATPDGS